MQKKLNKTVYITYYQSKLGKISLVATDKGLTRVLLPLNNYSNFEAFISTHYEVKNGVNSILLQACRELDEFFSYKRKKFTVPLDIDGGTDFQKSVWKSLLKIPFGKTCSYKQIAIMINNPGAVRAVGLANKANPIPLFIPCHRVIGKNGALTGFAGSDPKNLEFKSNLLNFEKNKYNLLNFQ